MTLNSLVHKALLSTMALAAATLCVAPTTASAHPGHASGAHYVPHGRDVSVSVERPGGRTVASYWYGGAMYVAGDHGQRYQLRVTNHTGARVEAVVTVDGRDVVSGEVGDYRSQRGYVIEPWGDVVIDGFRRTLDHVAAFRFSDSEDSYSARRGTPQHVGVIGVAVFKERRRHSRRTPRPVQPKPPHRYYHPYDDADLEGGSTRRSKRAPSSAPSAGAAADANAGGYGEAEAAPARERRDRGGSRGRYAPPPEPSNELGTEYGETRYSSVREVRFRRRNRRRPDSLLTVYYDSLRGLRARGVPVDPYPYRTSYHDEPEPFPSARGFAPPPPRRY